jgi:DUF1680 family protein
MLINEKINNQVLWEKIDHVAAGLIKCQEKDGYLGTYLPGTRWKQNPEEPANSWDPWVAKYNIIALLRYYHVKKNEEALNTARRIADQIIFVFGEGGDCNLNLTDDHFGLASGSLLEAIMLLYGVTGEKKYLDFGGYVVKYYWGEEAPGTPHIIERMADPDKLRYVGKGKCYEMMSCFVGLLEYARYSGEDLYLDKVIAARNNIAKYHRQLNGCMSEHEWFRDPGTAGERDDLENCVAFTWIQLNTRLFELTGDPCCMDYAEETALNHILAALSPDASTWIYYLTLVGPKAFTYWSQIPDSASNSGAPMTCCQTNGQRALGLLPRYIYTTDDNDVSINLFFDSLISIELPQGKITLTQKTDFPRSGNIVLSVEAASLTGINIRFPSWAKSLKINSKTYNSGEQVRIEAAAGKTEFHIELEFSLRLLTAGNTNRGKFAIAYGPLVYALDSCPDGWNFDEVSLLLDKKTIFGNISIEKENGWVKLGAEAVRSSADIGILSWQNIPDSLEHAKVILRPFMFAGLDGNLDYSQHYDETNLVYNKSPELRCYRIMYPCFFT